MKLRESQTPDPRLQRTALRAAAEPPGRWAAEEKAEVRRRAGLVMLALIVPTITLAQAAEAPARPTASCASSPSASVGRRARVNPRKFDFKAFLSRDEKDCGIAIEPLQYHDFDGDGVDEVLVVASTCYTGTAGPDIHAVYKVLSTSEAIELPINETRGALHGSNPYDELVGNRSYFLYVDDAGRLVEEFHDSSVRPEGESPLILYFKWNGKEFTLGEVKRHVRGRF